MDTFVVPGIDIGLVGQQQFYNPRVALRYRAVQRREALVVLGIDISLVGQERFPLHTLRSQCAA